MKDSREYERRLEQKLQHLVRILGLDSGQVRMDVHHGTIPVVVIDHSVRIPIRTDSQPDEQAHEQDPAREFVIDKLEPFLRTMVGQYGSVSAEVASGTVGNFRLERKCRSNKARDKQQK